MKSLLVGLSLSAAVLLSIGSVLTVTASVAQAETAQISFDVGGQPYATRALDLLFVIDDSASMQAHQQRLSVEIAKLASSVQNSTLSLQVGVITTSDDMPVNPAQPPSKWDPKRKGGHGQMIGGVLSNSSPDFIKDLTARLLVGTEGNATEMVFDPVIHALKNDANFPENVGFLRPDAALAVVVLTDAEDQSQTYRAANFAQDLLALKPGRPELVSFIAAFIPANIATPSSCTRDDMQPFVLTEAITALKGTTINLCDANMGDQLVTAIQATKKGVGAKAERREFKLPVAAQFDTLKVSYGATVLKAGDVLNGWTLRTNTNILRIGDKVDYKSEPMNTRLKVEFEY